MMRLAFAFLLALATTGAAFAQSKGAEAPWPNRAIRFIVPLPAGAAADVIARLIGQKLSERLGQPVIIENRAGASGVIGSDVVAKAAPDGYTLGMATSTTHVTAAVLNPKLPYDPVKDFAPISLIGISPYVLTLHPSVPAQNLAEFIALAKAKPGTINYSSVGDASLAHLAGQLFSRMAGVQLNQVPYKSSTQAVTDLLEGRIEMQFGILTTTTPYIRDKKLRAIGVTTEKRVPELPDVPTLAEAGLPGFEVALWFAAVMPQATPPAIVSRLNQEINSALSDPDVKKLLATQMIQVQLSTPDELRERIRKDVEKWTDLASKAGVKAQ
jgi:tripartite-type tricarboxylate transporter receptor subunit TctC